MNYYQSGLLFLHCVYDDEEYNDDYDGDELNDDDEEKEQRESKDVIVSMENDKK